MLDRKILKDAYERNKAEFDEARTEFGEGVGVLEDIIIDGIFNPINDLYDLYEDHYQVSIDEYILALEERIEELEGELRGRVGRNRSTD